MTHTRLALGLAWALLAASAAAAQAPDPVRTITPLRGNLYRAQEGPRVTVFRVDADGIVLVDPMDVPFAKYLQEEFAQRFPDRPVKYVVYSGVDLERVGGAGVFDTTAEIIAHREFNDRSNRARHDQPALAEHQLYAESQFASRRTLYDGDAPIDLIYAGSGIVGAQVLVYFRTERVLFASTHPPLTAPFSNREIRPPAVARWMAAAREIEFDTLLDGRGDTATRADVLATDAYVKGLMDGMADGNVRGLSAQQVQASAARFDGTPFAQVRDSDIAALYQRSNLMNFDAFAGPLINRISADFALCAGGDCTLSSDVGPGWSAGAGVTMARLRILGEFSRGAPIRLAEYTLQSRETHLTFLAGYRLGSAGRFNVTPLGGFTYVSNAYTYRVDYFGSVQEGDGVVSRLRLTFGGDVTMPIRPRVSLIVPVRFTPGVDFLAGTRNRLGIRVGAAFAFTYHRRAM